MRGNKGEWSEAYAWLKVLADGKLVPGDEDLAPLTGRDIAVLSVQREEEGEVTRYDIDTPEIEIQSSRFAVKRVPQFKVQSVCKAIYRSILNTKEKTFEVPIASEFLESIGCRKLKASSNSKADFYAIIRDIETSETPRVGYSVKSQLGGASTLLNAGRTTNFIYKVKGDFSQNRLNQLNTMSGPGRLKRRIEQLYRDGATLEFAEMENSTFRRNLVYTDSLMPGIVAALLLEYYRGNGVNFPELVQSISVDDIQMHEEDLRGYLMRKTKQLLSDIALGMVPSKPWNGSYKATGAFAMVREDGELVTYHLYNKDEFEAYLYRHTRLDTASMSRHGFGEFYFENGEAFIKLNLQIRFRL